MSVPLDRLFLVRCLHFFDMSEKIRAEFKSEMSLLDVSHLLEKFRHDLSDWPFTDLSSLGIETGEDKDATEKPRRVSDFERGLVLSEGAKNALANSVTDPIPWLQALINCHPDTKFGPPMSIVTNGVAEDLNLPNGFISEIPESNPSNPIIEKQTDDAKDDNQPQRQGLPPRRTVQLTKSDNGA